MIKFILQTLTFLFSFNLLAYEIDGIAPSGFDFDTICGIEGSEMRTYRNLVEAHQMSLERVKG